MGRGWILAMLVLLLLLGGCASTAPLVDDVVPVAVCSANARSRADWNRSSGRFSRQCRIT